jgi:ferric-dicitrate binding protein FerR (iron transport regulator)
MRSIETDELTASIHTAPEQISIIEEAADWFLRARDRPLTAAEQQALTHWFRQSPRHIAEFIRMYQLHGWLREAKLQPFEAAAIPRADTPQEVPLDRRTHSIVRRLIGYLFTR